MRGPTLSLARRGAALPILALGLFQIFAAAVFGSS